MELQETWPPMMPKKCEVCGTVQRLLRCTGCNTHFYCSREHQAQDRPIHKSTCKSIKDAKKRADDAEAMTRAHGNFESLQGDFWDHIKRLYLKGRLIHRETLIVSRRQQGIEDALALFLMMLQHGRADHLGCRRLIPALYLQLGRDQECYDFLKWWATADREEKALCDTSRPYLDIRDADATSHEDVVKFWVSPKTAPVNSLFHLAPLLLLKMRLLNSIREFHNYRDEHPDVTPEEAVLKIRPELAVGDILERRPDLIADNKLLDKAEDQVYESVHRLISKVQHENDDYLAMPLTPVQGPTSLPCQTCTRLGRRRPVLRLCSTFTRGWRAPSR
ncbi:hypothetical protein V8F33_009909 [Rhypophila sp. PSN 637]